MRKILLFCITVSCLTLAAGKNFRHELKDSKKPWTHENFLNGKERFSFAIIPDRTGSERPGVFLEAIKKANMLQPEFIMTVGDLIQGPTELDRQSPAHLREMWKELEGFTKQSEAPFFYVVGNHDISRTRQGFPRANEDSKMVWQEFAGKDTYYYFIYNNCLFLCLNTMDGRDARVPQVEMTKEQVKWAVDVLKKHKSVHWTLVFMHQPSVCASKIFAPIEKELVKRNYTVFAGDWHHYIKFKRHNRNYYVLGTAGGISDLRGKEYGEFDHITFVTMTKNGPVVANILLDGILPDDAVTAATSARTFRTLLDTEPFKPAPGYPWKAIVDTHMLKKYVSTTSLDNNVITIANRNAEEIIELAPPVAADKKFKLTVSACATLAPGSSFSVVLKEFDSAGKLIKQEGVILNKTTFWMRGIKTIKTSSKTAKLRLCIESKNFDKNSVGKARYIFVEEVK